MSTPNTLIDNCEYLRFTSVSDCYNLEKTHTYTNLESNTEALRVGEWWRAQTSHRSRGLLPRCQQELLQVTLWRKIYLKILVIIKSTIMPDHIKYS